MTGPGWGDMDDPEEIAKHLNGPEYHDIPRTEPPAIDDEPSEGYTVIDDELLDDEEEAVAPRTPITKDMVFNRGTEIAQLLGRLADKHKDPSINNIWGMVEEYAMLQFKYGLQRARELE